MQNNLQTFEYVQIAFFARKYFFLMKGHSMSEQNRRRFLANIDSILDCSCEFFYAKISEKNLLRFGFSFIFFLNISFEQENIKHLGYRIIKPFTNYSLIRKQRVGKIFRTNTKNVFYINSILYYINYIFLWQKDHHIMTNILNLKV